MISSSGKFSFFLKDVKKHPKRRAVYYLLLAVFIFIPGSTYYSTLSLKTYRPLVQQANFSRPPVQAYPALKTNATAIPATTAQSVIIMDVSSGVVMFSKNPATRMLPASTTKLMTALVALDNCSLDKVITVKKLNITDEDSLMGLVENEMITVKNLSYGLLIPSGNDAAITLSENCSSSPEQFIYSMNQKAKDLGLKNTHFSNVIGLEQDNHYSSAQDLAFLATVFIRNPVLSKIVATKEIIVSDVEGQHWHTLKNINLLLGNVWGVTGVKTGYTENAGECLITLVERNGRKVLVVVLKSQDRFPETEKLIDWIFNSFSWQEITPAIDS